MPELPDIAIYIEALQKKIIGQYIKKVRIYHPFLVRTVEPPVSVADGKCVVNIKRVGKRIGIGIENEIWLVFHLMIAGRLHWSETPPRLKTKWDLAAIDLTNGSLFLRESGTKKRASLHMVQGQNSLRTLDPGGLEILEAKPDEFFKVLTGKNHTLKRALTDPRLFSGIGNAYSDEILHRAGLSPLSMTQNLSENEMSRLFEAAKGTLNAWINRLRLETGNRFPEKVTAFRHGMAVHGRFNLPCPSCGTVIHRIRYSANETHYCPGCQTGGKRLADRALSRLLKKDWPRTIEDWERGKPT